MAAKQNDIRRWLKEGKRQKATHMIVVVDTFDYTDYPVYVKKDQNVHEVAKTYQLKDMQRVMEVYSYKLDLEAQINEQRSFHYD